MPLVKLYLRKGKSPEYVRSVADAVHDALVAAANVPADDRFQIIQQLEDDRLIAHPTYGGVNRSRDLIMVEITLNSGRTVEIKKKLYDEILCRMGSAADVRHDVVLLSLDEVSEEDWAYDGVRET